MPFEFANHRSSGPLLNFIIKHPRCTLLFCSGILFSMISVPYPKLYFASASVTLTDGQKGLLGVRMYSSCLEVNNTSPICYGKYLSPGEIKLLSSIDLMF